MSSLKSAPEVYRFPTEDDGLAAFSGGLLGVTLASTLWFSHAANSTPPPRTPVATSTIPATLTYHILGAETSIANIESGIYDIQNAQPNVSHSSAVALGGIEKSLQHDLRTGERRLHHYEHQQASYLARHRPKAQLTASTSQEGAPHHRTTGQAAELFGGLAIGGMVVGTLLTAGGRYLSAGVRRHLIVRSMRKELASFGTYEHDTANQKNTD